MDTRTGEIAAYQAMAARVPKQFLKEIDATKLTKSKQKELHQTGHTKVGRNEKCPCGSGKKFKQCCLFKQSDK